jgi:glycosyltransferase involved in cell wall biosynthesis
MKLNESLISVVLPVTNGAAYLPSCLDSLLKQNYENIEIIAIDDKSKDDSYAILKRFKALDERVRVYRNKKRYGLSVCYNRAIKKARGQFITFMNPYDKNALNRFQRQVKYLTRNQKVVAVGTQVTHIDGKEKNLETTNFPVTHEAIYRNFLRGLTMQFESVLINRFLLPKDVLKFSSNTRPFLYTEVFVKILQYGQVANLSWPLYYHRKYISEASVKLTKLKKGLTLGKLWVKSVSEHDYRPSLGSLLTPQVEVK